LKKKLTFKNLLYFISAALVFASIYMYTGIDHGQDQQLQSSSIKFTDRQKKAKNTKRNPYVIWNGSNEMPPGLDNKKELKSNSSDDQNSTAQGQGGSQSQASSSGGIQPPTQSTAQGGSSSGIDVSKGEGITPATPPHGGSSHSSGSSSGSDMSSPGVGSSAAGGSVTELNPGESGGTGGSGSSAYGGADMGF
jgi:hypothetical protein